VDRTSRQRGIYAFTSRGLSQKIASSKNGTPDRAAGRCTMDSGFLRSQVRDRFGR